MCEKTSLSRLRLPSQHPFLFFTEEELQALKETISTEAWAKQNAESILSHAENLVERQGFEVPESWVGGMGTVREVRSHLPKPLAMAYALTGDILFARKAREILLSLCDLRWKALRPTPLRPPSKEAQKYQPRSPAPG